MQNLDISENQSRSASVETTAANWEEPEAVLDRYPESSVRIRFQDCDPFGHLNNARYLDYFFNAREQQLKECYGLDLFAPRFADRAWVVRYSTISHRLPARVNESVLIRTVMLHHTRASIQVEGTMLSADGERTLAVSRVEFRYVDVKRGRPVRHEADLMSMFERISFNTPFDFGDDRRGARAS